MRRSAEEVDVLIVGEGTYPYIRGGVSSWIHQLIQGMPELRFGVVFLGSKEEDYEGIQYEFPENLVYFTSHYLFQNVGDTEVTEPVPGRVDPELLEGLHGWFDGMEEGSMPEELSRLEFYNEEVRYEDFLHSKGAWEFIRRRYERSASDLPFIDYFWTVRNMHLPIWELAALAKGLPRFGVVHSPSTGYAGFLASLLSYDRKRPMLLTEHGIYTIERKIDLLNADWVSYEKPSLLQQPEEFNYIKQMWVNFFDRIGRFSYRRAERIFSLFDDARRKQLALGAPAKKCEVVPNGVDVPRLERLDWKRGDRIPHVVVLIGRVVAIKDIKTFIRAIRIATQSIEDLEGWVVGPLDEDPIYAQECKNMVETFRLEKQVRFLGYRSIDEILPDCGLVTLSSVSEGMPLSILEGFAAGLPAVTTDVGSCRELIEGGSEEDRALGSAGRVTAIADASALAKAYVELFENETLYRQSQQAARARVRLRYRKEQMIGTYRRQYEEAIRWQG